MSRDAAVVVDANLILAQVVEVDYSRAARERFRDWIQAGARLAAPALWTYEVLSALRKFRAAGRLTAETTQAVGTALLSLGIEVVPMTPALAERTLHWAEQLEQTVAYDSSYLAVAESLEAELWTADRALARRARQLGLSWVHAIAADLTL